MLQGADQSEKPSQPPSHWLTVILTEKGRMSQYMYEIYFGYSPYLLLDSEPNTQMSSLDQIMPGSKVRFKSMEINSRTEL